VKLYHSFDPEMRFSATGRGGACATCSGGLLPQAAAGCLSVSTERLSFAMAMAGAFAALRRPSRGEIRHGQWQGAFSLARSDFRSPWHWQVPLPRCGDRAEGARPRPLHSPALRQPHSPLRGAFTPSAFLTDRRRFAPAQRRLSRHPCRSSWKASLVQRVGMSLHNPRCTP